MLVIFQIVGCAGIEEITPAPQEILKRPLGTDSVKVGMTKDEVRSLWGEPDQINYVKNENRWAGEREEWVYKGKYETLPVDAGYLFKTKKLYFDGENLTNIVEE